MSRPISKTKNNIMNINFINNLSIVIGLASLFSWIYFCIRLNSWSLFVHPNPILDMGLLLLVVSIVKQGTCWWFSHYKKLATILYSFLMLGLVILIFGYSVFALFVTHKGHGRVIPMKAYKDYNKIDYSPWLQRYLHQQVDWEIIELDLLASQCNEFSRKYSHLNDSEFYATNLSPIESGCCKPPNYCEFGFKNATKWKVKYPDWEECELNSIGFRMCDISGCQGWIGWDDESAVCWTCSSCKGAVLDNIKREWRHIAFINFFILIISFISILYLFNHSQSHKYL